MTEYVERLERRYEDDGSQSIEIDADIVAEVERFLRDQ